jgi:spermidine synthase
LDDGFKFVETTKKKYDIIITDLLTETSEIDIYDENFYNNLSKILTPNGYVAINYFAWKDTEVHAQHICDLKNTFEEVIELPNPYPKNNNCITHCTGTYTNGAEQ